jgi:hypothetical protein
MSNGSLIKINETVADNTANTMTVTGIDSTYDVYVVVQSNIKIAAASAFTHYRFTTGGTDDTSANYDYASEQLSADRAFTNVGLQNSTSFGIDSMHSADFWNAVIYLHNFNSSDEYSFFTYELSHTESTGNLRSQQGAGVLTVAQACDGLTFYPDSGNIASGTMTLYGLHK